MTTQKKLGALLTCAAVLTVCLGLVAYSAPKTHKVYAPTLAHHEETAISTTSTESPSATKQQTISLTIMGLYAQKQVAITAGDTALSVLKTLTMSDTALQLNTKEYAGLGTLVVSMHGLKNGVEHKYWQYKVNGVIPQVGAASYTLQPSDTVEWIFAPSTF